MITSVVSLMYTYIPAYVYFILLVVLSNSFHSSLFFSLLTLFALESSGKAKRIDYLLCISLPCLAYLHLLILSSLSKT